MLNLKLLLLLLPLWSTEPSIKTDKLSEALAFAKKNKLDTTICIMVDMSLPSGKNRLFVYDFTQKKTIIAGMCAHGVGGGSTAQKPVFSNKVGSNCTSLGKYKVKNRAYSNWGINIHYKMYGLEESNNNAFKRIVVLHSYTPIPNYEIYPGNLFGQSAGCPVIADDQMRQIDKLLIKKKKAVLLWIYN
ncbi:MAG: murein L,D-transpeptidase catalytic domain family protein [Pedobacter sp.]|uniref:murein L,D-transpeptidase catalytic domain-containing protein n=1 Tax=Pedobacter sp. TaxID=1411316 RepID=UPI002809D2A6|nr:murein L,D-transpeptidase catalytic domain family protein [Pedobacter sp.]MDQ8006682.1 murein L,D-transpeptidase catalytic domain family protein [Pedobacter sp.]